MKVRVSALKVQRMADSLRGCFSGESEEIGIDQIEERSTNICKAAAEQKNQEFMVTKHIKGYSTLLGTERIEIERYLFILHRL